MKRTMLVMWALLAFGHPLDAQLIPKPEHPRPDAVRPHWVNLNGSWQFRFDPADEGVASKWYEPAGVDFDKQIVVPFGWESPLSRVADKSGASKIGWYRRRFRVPEDFPEKDRLWLRFEAVDWQADVWVNGEKAASHEGGYTPFQADITDLVKRGQENELVVRAFDPTDPALPTGKQVHWYTPTSGIWQTVWLESRPKPHIADFTIKTLIDPARVEITATVAGSEAGSYHLIARSTDPNVEKRQASFKVSGAEAKQAVVSLTMEVKEPRLWTPEAPNLYELTLDLANENGDPIDSIATYFGLRTIARGRYGDAAYEYVLLNGKPIYLRGALDQSFNPEGVYTAPSDEFLKRDIASAKELGLNFLRIHIKPDEPRRTYWADKLGLLIMQDMPNTWEQDPESRRTWELTMRETIARDKNHPAIFCWVAFNETWGLGGRRDYKEDKDSQEWVKRVVAEIRSLDPTRLVEDNSPCNYDHLSVTDLNSWHFYIDNHEAARDHINEVVERSTPGSDFNMCPGEAMNSAPLINSEYGAVSAGGGDRDVSWGFRDLTTQLRKHPKIQGYVYTELTDIEWEHNGFLNYDRTLKEFGYGEFLPDMRIFELQQPDFVGYDAPPCIVAKPGETIRVPVFISHYSDRTHPVLLRWWLQGWDHRGNIVMAAAPRTIPGTWEPYKVTWQEPIEVKVPDHPFVGALALTLRDPVHPPGQLDPRFAANYVNVVVRAEGGLPRAERRNDHEAVLRFRPEDYAGAHWTDPVKAAKGKAAGRGTGSFEYHIQVPEAVRQAGPKEVYLRFEASAKAGRELVDWPERSNRLDYPQTDQRKWPTTISVTLNGEEVIREVLESDWADSRGVLSHLRRVDHGSFGDLLECGVELPAPAKAALAEGKPLVLRFSVPENAKPAGGLVIYGDSTGLFPFDPTLEISTERPLPADLGVDPQASVAVDTLVSRQVELLQTGEAGPELATLWRFTTKDPGPGWENAEFDDGAWSTGRGGFGTRGTPGLAVGTQWNQKKIWIRTSVEMPALKPSDLLVARLYHDEDARVLVNGKPLLDTRGYVTEYQDFSLDSAQVGLFHPGKNLIAVECLQNSGGQGVDLGLYLQRQE